MLSPLIQPKRHQRCVPPFPPQTAAAIFPAGLELLSVKAVMRKLSRGVVRRGRASSTKMSVMGAAAAGLKGGRGSTGLLKKGVPLAQGRGTGW